jgi:excinuclease ABC subunit C
MTTPPKAPVGDSTLDAPPETPLDDDETEAGFELALAEDEAAPNALARGAAAIKDYWKQAPVGPGVYRMIAADGEVLYVGKARSSTL